MTDKYKKLFEESLIFLTNGKQQIESEITPLMNGINQDKNEVAPTPIINKKLILYLSINRFLSHAQAFKMLCEHKLNAEACFVLRPILELSVNLLWIIKDETNENLGEFLGNTEYEWEDGTPKMGGKWTRKNLLVRMEEIGFDRHYYDNVVKKLHEEIHVHPTRIARSYDKEMSELSSEAIYAIACQMTGHVLKGGFLLYPENGFFVQFNNIWRQISVRER